MAPPRQRHHARADAWKGSPGVSFGRLVRSCWPPVLSRWPWVPHRRTKRLTRWQGLKKTLTEAASALGAFSGDGKQIEAELEKVRDAVNSVGWRRRQTFLAQRSDELKAWLDSDEVIRTDRILLQSLNSLVDTATAYEATRRSDAPGRRRAQRLLAILDKEWTWRETCRGRSCGKSSSGWRHRGHLRRLGMESPVRRSENPCGWANGRSRSDRASSFESDFIFEAAESLLNGSNRRWIRRQARVPGSGIDKTALEWRGQFRGNKGIKERLTNLANLNAQIRSTVQEAVGPRVHVVSARYGDIRADAAEGRTCDATAAVVKSCERTSNCTIEEPSSVCGYDPVPFAEARHKALVITYSCVVADDDYWNRLQQDREASGRGGSSDRYRASAFRR